MPCRQIDVVTMNSIDLPALHGLLRPHGLVVRGVTTEAESSVVVIGHAGAEYWPHFQGWLALQAKQLDHPLDGWSREIIEGVARQCQARAVFPSDRPYRPFQRWAMEAEGLKPSPLGILMHPEYGLWHAYRGALLFEQSIEAPAGPAPLHLCDSCRAKPCLKACPVSAYDGVGFAHDACRSHVGSKAGDACRSGCLDRNACPHGAAYRYPVEVQTFHQAAFLR